MLHFSPQGTENSCHCEVCMNANKTNLENEGLDCTPYILCHQMNLSALWCQYVRYGMVTVRVSKLTVAGQFILVK